MLLRCSQKSLLRELGWSWLDHQLDPGQTLGLSFLCLRQMIPVYPIRHQCHGSKQLMMCKGIYKCDPWWLQSILSMLFIPPSLQTFHGKNSEWSADHSTWYLKHDFQLCLDPDSNKSIAKDKDSHTHTYTHTHRNVNRKLQDFDEIKDLSLIFVSCNHCRYRYRYERVCIQLHMGYL